MRNLITLWAVILSTLGLNLGFAQTAILFDHPSSFTPAGITPDEATELLYIRYTNGTVASFDNGANHLLDIPNIPDGMIRVNNNVIYVMGTAGITLHDLTGAQIGNHGSIGGGFSFLSDGRMVQAGVSNGVAGWGIWNLAGTALTNFFALTNATDIRINRSNGTIGVIAGQSLNIYNTLGQLSCSEVALNGAAFDNTGMNLYTGYAAGIFVQTSAGGSNCFSNAGPISVGQVDDICYIQGVIVCLQSSQVNGYADGQPLPVELISFDVEAQGDQHQLFWEAASELNFSRYEVERSLDGSSSMWEKISEVEAQGAGRYDVAVQAISSETHYYRLRMVDIDGTFEFSKIISARGESSDELSVYPNPTRNKVTLSEDATLYSAQGKQLQKLKAGENRLCDLPAGIYTIRTQKGKSSRLVIE